MLKYVVGTGVVQYATETWTQAMRRHERMVAHNEAVDRELARWRNPPTCEGCGYPAGWHTPKCRLAHPT